MKTLRINYILVGILFLPFIVNSQATSCANAIASPAIPTSSVLTSNVACSNTTFTLPAAFSGTVGSCVGATHPTFGWFSFIAVGNLTTVSITGGSKNIALVVWTADCALTTQVACSNTNSTSASATFSTTVGTQYLIEIVRTVGGGGAASGNICVTHAPLPAFTNNGDCTSLTNSYLEAYPGISTIPGNWSSVLYDDPVCEATDPMYASPDASNAVAPSGYDFRAIPQSGGTCVSGLHAGSVASRYQEGIQQSISGFTSGNIYTITFYQCVVKQASCPDPTGSWIVYADNTLLGISAVSTSLTPTVDDVNVIWDKRTITFTATASTHVIKFLPQDNDVNLSLFVAGELSGVRMGLDNISITCPIVLPITLIDFSGKRNGNFADISWRTGSEINSDKFILERTIDGQYWDFVMKVDGAGNSFTPKQYFYVDRNTNQVISYYRLTQVDYNGHQTFSDVISIEGLKQDDLIGIYPNPPEKFINIYSDRISLMNSTIYIFDIAGNILIKEFISNDVITKDINIEKLIPGLYFIQIENKDYSYQTKFLKK
ncbi:MAG: T9SS type A sorting domain-containing protein [Flavobacteriia bacterium]|nr:T9SS type A sorting domain-containing protein [Flavobacteriia bacterium]